jgi:hypothetical protein
MADEQEPVWEDPGEHAGNEHGGKSGDPDDLPTLRARVPEPIALGVFSTGAIIGTGPHECVVDFLQTLLPPPRLAARIIMPHVVFTQFVRGMDENLSHYRQTHGPIQSITPPPLPTQSQNIDDVYDELKIADEALRGVYATGFMITHSQAELGIDFVATFMPQPVVVARIYMAITQAPQLHESLRAAHQQWRDRHEP